MLFFKIHALLYDKQNYLGEDVPEQTYQIARKGFIFI